jgi:hypothetical protein
VPQSDCTTTLEKYLGRTDAIILSSNGDFRVIEGTSSNKPKLPDIPNDGLLINYLVIPPYPSLPKNNSANTVQFLDKRISNIKFTTKRQTDYKVTTPIDTQGLVLSQPKRYTMKEIGSLERRIADLEYYTSLSATEDTINKLELTSSADNTTNRFKFGFFVDNFTTTNFADINDPTYNAQIYGYELHPAKRQVQIKYQPNFSDNDTNSCLNGEKIVLPSTRKRLIGQSIATEATTVDVTITTTVSSGTQTQSSSTTVTQIPTQQFQTQIGSTLVPKTSTVADTNGSLGYLPKLAGRIWSRKFEVGKLAGTITATGDCQQNKGNLPYLQRYVNGVWTTVASGLFNGNGNRIWAISYSYTPNAAGTNRQFRVILDNNSGTADLDRGSYPRTKDVTTYDRVSTTSTNAQTNTRTTTQIVPQTTVVESTTSITKPLFNSKLTGMMTIDNIFNPPSKLSSPFIDLAAIIQNDINS